MLSNNYDLGLKKYGIKLTFNLSSTKPKTTRINYVHQQLMLSKKNYLGDSKIYDKKQYGYHKVKCISKGFEKEITKACGDDDVSRSSHPCRC